MGNRYINTSEMTTHMAKGILLYARCQNMPYGSLSGSAAEQEWESWKAQFPEWTRFIEQEQYSLFTRVQMFRDSADNYSHAERLTASGKGELPS